MPNIKLSLLNIQAPSVMTHSVSGSVYPSVKRMKKNKSLEKPILSHPLRFIDLFAGIGGFHLGLHAVGAQCVFASEWNEHARKTYVANIKKISPNLFKHNQFVGDINLVTTNTIPDFDILCGGFPCQPFSNAGHGLGFNDHRGNLFFNIVDILKTKKPSAFFLENVRGLLNHDDGRTFETIKHILTVKLGYSFHWKIVKGSDFGVPQTRPRLYMVGFKNSDTPFEFPKELPLIKTMSDVLGGKCSRNIGFTLRVGGRGSPITDRRNWDRYLVNGKEIQLNSKHARIMQGFPERYKFPVTETQAMKQLGNSVVVPAITAVAHAIVQALMPPSSNH